MFVINNVKYCNYQKMDACRLHHKIQRLPSAILIIQDMLCGKKSKIKKNVDEFGIIYDFKSRTKP